MERVDRDDPKNQHRDLSHLIALHPVTITRDGTGIEARTLDHGHLHFPTEGGASYRITPC